MIYFASDWHFNHNKDFLYARRGFSLVEDMNAAVIEQHNSIVTPDDEVYFLGDGYLTCDTEGGVDCIRRLNGKIHWIIGNHDTDNKIAAIQANCPNVKDFAFGARIKHHKMRFFLSHYPTLCANPGDRYHTYNLCGHTHDTDPFALWQFYCYNVGMDAHDCRPTSIEQVAADIKNKMN